MGPRIAPVLFLAVVLSASPVAAVQQLSEETKECFGCHQEVTPGIVDDWMRSHHATITPNEALTKPRLKKKISAPWVRDDLGKRVVGCAECHMMNPEKHPDTFTHNGYNIHVVVTPEDCASCHPEERTQFEGNLMAHARKNLEGNPVYHTLSRDINSTLSLEEGKLVRKDPEPVFENDSCYSCHGTVVAKVGMHTRDTAMGEMEFPLYSGWPNQGVGRVNPDGSRGSCTACHTRHQFSIVTARKPHTCSECHKGPDVPAYATYLVSKHGNIYESHKEEWEWHEVPWKAGVHFTAPTCATCHVSLVVDAGGEGVIAPRTHTMGDRSAWRLMGLIYAAPHPKSPDTSAIRNKAGLPLPTELTGEPAAEFLIDKEEQGRRRKTMMNICGACHTYEWVDGQFKYLEETIKATNEATLTATKIMLTAWEKGACAGLAQNDSPFNEALEKKWVEQWLFYANSARYASAMQGADYGVFANGRWQMNKNLTDMWDWLQFKLGTMKK
jgi:hypothetical protein